MSHVRPTPYQWPTACQTMETEPDIFGAKALKGRNMIKLSSAREAFTASHLSLSFASPQMLKLLLCHHYAKRTAIRKRSFF